MLFISEKEVVRGQPFIFDIMWLSLFELLVEKAY